MIQRLAANTTAEFVFKALTMLLGFVAIPVLVATIGADGFGVILLAQAIMGYFGVLDAGVPAGTVKYVAEYDARDDRRSVDAVIASSLVFFLAAGVLVGAAAAAFAALDGIRLFNVAGSLQGAAARVLYLAAALAVVQWPLATLGQVLDGLQRYPENRLAMGIGSIADKGAAIAVALAGAPIEGVFLAMNVGLLVRVPLQYRAIRRVLPGWAVRPGDFDAGTMKTIFGYSVWMLLGRVAGLLIYQADRIILGVFLPVASLTVYEVVTMPFTYIKQASSTFNSALTPAVSAEAARRGRAGLDGFIHTVSRYSNAFVAPLAVVGAFLAGPLIGLWMGPEYMPYAWIAQVACLFQLLWQSNSALGRVFYGSGRVRRIMLLSFVLAVVNIPLGVWWVQEIGVAGVVLSTVLVGVLAVPLQYVLVMPELEIDRRRYFRESIVRAQSTSWVLGLLLLPFWDPLQAIDSWAAFLAVGALLAAVFYGASWWTVVEPRHRERVRRTVAARLSSSRSEGR